MLLGYPSHIDQEYACVRFLPLEAEKYNEYVGVCKEAESKPRIE